MFSEQRTILDTKTGFMPLPRQIPRPWLEPGTYGLEGRCSIQLSYRGLFRIAETEPNPTQAIFPEERWKKQVRGIIMRTGQRSQSGLYSPESSLQILVLFSDINKVSPVFFLVRCEKKAFIFVFPVCKGT